MNSASRISSLACVLFGSASLFGQVVNFDSLNSYTAPLEARLTEIRLLPGALVPTSAQGSTIWADFSVAGYESDQEVGRYERDFDWTSGKLAYRYGVGEWSFGLLGAVQDGSLDSDEINPGVPDPATGRIDSDGYLGSIFVTYDGEALSVQLLAGWGEGDNDMERSSDLGPNFGHSFSQYDTHSTFARLRVAKAFTVGETWSLTPYGALAIARIEADGFTEMGGPDRRIVEGFDDKQESLELGLEITAGTAWYAPRLTLAYWHDFSNDGVELDVSAANEVFLGTLTVPDAFDNLFIGGLSIGGEMDNGFVGRLRLDYVAGGDSTAVSVGGTLGYAF